MHLKAVRLLIAATAFWAISFPIVKAMAMLQGQLVPEAGSWFHASLTAFARFGVSALVLLVLFARQIARCTRLELTQGVALGLFGGGGILLQMDGLAYTEASTSAFLTQSFCIWVPLYVALRDRRLPTLRISLALAMMLAGVAVLTGFNPRTFHIGRGEAETLLSGVFFAGQLLSLEHPAFRGNRLMPFSFVMFGTMTLVSVPILAASAPSAQAIATCYANPGVLLLAATLILSCTLAAFLMMNKWQPFVPATEAAIIYGIEPVLTSGFALFLPGLLSAWLGLAYPNETLTVHLIFGGGLIFAANLLVQAGWQPTPSPASAAPKGATPASAGHTPATARPARSEKSASRPG